MRLDQVILRGTRAAQPAAGTVPAGSLYFVTDEEVSERSSGSAWEAYSGDGDALTAAEGDVRYAPLVHAARHQAGGADAVALDLLAPPTDVTTLNASTSAHGLLPKLPGGTTDYLRADGTFAPVPAGGITQLTGEVTAGPGAGAQAATITPAAVTFAKLQALPASTVVGREASGAGVAQALALGSGFLLTGTTLSAPRKSVSNLVNYVYNTGAEPPTAGQVRTDLGFPFTSTTKLWLRFVSNDDEDIYWGIMVLTAGMQILLQDQDDHTRYARFTVTGAPIDKGLYAEVPVAWVANGTSILTGSQTLMQATAAPAPATPAARVGAVGLVLDGGGSVLTTGVKGFVEVPFACTITAATLLSTDAAVTAGSIVVDIWKDTYANYPPVVGDSITASAKPTLSSATKSRDTTLTGWTKTLAAGDVLGFSVDSVATLTRVAVSLTVQGV